METTQELKYAVKDVLVDMAIDGTLPLDMTTLDIDEIFSMAEAKLKGDEAYQDRLTLSKLGEFVNIEVGEEDAVLQKWKSLTSANDKDMADDHFTMWQPLEYSLTIKELAEQL